MVKQALLLLAAIGLLSVWGCGKESGPDTGFDLDELPLERLSDYQLFDGDLANLKAGEYLLPYDLNTPLFTDYALKARFVYVPPGATAEYNDEGVIDFPQGSLIFKTFYFLTDYTNSALGKRILETRLLARHEDGWRAYSYRWSDDQTEANYKITGGPLQVDWVHTDGMPRSTNYLIPNLVECENCHQIGDPLQPLGPKAGNLNREYDYDDGSGMVNQLDRWTSTGFLIGSPDPTSAPRWPSWDDDTQDLDQRARVYLDVNCAHCHRPEGDADNSGLFLNIENGDMSALGICKPPVAAGAGSGGHSFAIVPGKPDSSIMVYRMNSNDLDVVMPEIGRSVIHEEGLQLIREWIEAMAPAGCQ